MLQRKGNDTHTRHSREEEMVVSFRSSDSQLYGYYSVVLAIKRTKRRHLPDDDPAAGNVSSRSSARELNVYWPRSCSTLFAGDWPTALLLYYYWYIYFYYRRRSSHSIVIMWCDVWAFVFIGIPRAAAACKNIHHHHSLLNILEHSVRWTNSF